MKTKFILILLFGILLISFASATSIGVHDSGFTRGRVVYTAPVSLNYSTINVNNSEFWDGNAWSDTRWLNIDGSNANSNIDIGAYNFLTTGTLGAGDTTIDGTLIIDNTADNSFLLRQEGVGASIVSMDSRDAQTIMEITPTNTQLTGINMTHSTSDVGHGKASDSPLFDLSKTITGTDDMTSMTVEGFNIDITNSFAQQAVNGMSTVVQTTTPFSLNVEVDGAHTGTGVSMGPPNLFNEITTGFNARVIRSGTISIANSAYTGIVLSGQTLSTMDSSSYDNADGNPEFTTTGLTLTATDAISNVYAGTVTKTVIGLSVDAISKLSSAWAGGSGTTELNIIKIGSDVQQPADTSWAIKDISGYDWTLQSDNQKIFFGAGQDASIYYDGSNMIFITNETGDGLAWFSRNVSAEGFLTRTSVFDKSKGSALDFILDADDYKKAKKPKEINHRKFYGYTTYPVTDFSKPETEFYVETLSDGTEVTMNRTIYPHKKIEEAVNLNKEIDVLRQAVFELNERVKYLESVCEI